MDLTGKTALVTGGARRVGRVICETLARAGCHVVIHYHRSAHEAQHLAASLAQHGVRAHAVGADLHSARECEGLVTQAWARAGRIDFLVNNAAVFRKEGLLAISADDLSAHMHVNLMAPLILTRAFAARAPGGKIVNILDRRVASNETGCLAYLLSKKALGDLTLLAAAELAPRFSVNAVAPGPVMAPEPDASASAVREPGGHIPMGRRPTPEDVAEAVLYLLRAEAITGQILYVDGGQHLLGNGV